MAAKASRRMLTEALEVHHHPGLPLEYHTESHHVSKVMPPGYQELLHMGDQLLASAQKMPPLKKNVKATPYNARKPAYNKVIEDKEEHGKKRMRKSLLEIKKCSRKEDPETGKIKVNENGAAKRRMLSLKDKVLEMAEMVVGKNASDLATSDVEMALAFVLERKIYGVSVKNVLSHLPEKHPQSLEAMQKQFQKSVRRDFTNERIYAGPVMRAGLTKEALAELKKLDTHDVIAATGSGLRSLKKGPPKKRKGVKAEGNPVEGGVQELQVEEVERAEDLQRQHEEIEQRRQLEAEAHPMLDQHSLLEGIVSEEHFEGE